jgi:hypothetical protein
MVDLPFPSFASPLVSQADSNAAQQFVKKYRKRTRQFQSGVFVGEIAETARLFASPARALRKGVASIHRGMLGHLKDTLKRHPVRNRKVMRNLRKTLADTWLEWQYAVRPLISDLDDAGRAFRQIAQGRGFEIIRIRGTGGAEGNVYRHPDFSVSWGLPAGQTVPLPIASCDLETNDQVTVDYLYGWKNHTVSHDMPVPMTLGLTLSDFVPTVWELIPYSFLVDYFTNVGNVLDAWSISQVSFAWGQRTVRNCRTSRAYGLRCAPTGPYGPQYVSGGNSVSLSTTLVDRVRKTTAPMPSFDFSIPGFKSVKWLNILALANGRAEARRLASRL